MTVLYAQAASHTIKESLGLSQVLATTIMRLCSIDVLLKKGEFL